MIHERMRLYVMTMNLKPTKAKMTNRGNKNSNSINIMISGFLQFVAQKAAVSWIWFFERIATSLSLEFIGERIASPEVVTRSSPTSVARRGGERVTNPKTVFGGG